MSLALDHRAELGLRLDAAHADYMAGRIGDAAKNYRAIVEDIPDQPDALHMLGVIAFRAGKIELALQLCEEALRALPTFAQAWSNRALLLRVLGHREEALRSGRRAIACDPKLADGWDITGLLLREQSLYAAACQHHARAAALNPDNPHIQNNYAVGLAAIGCYEKAYRTACKAAALNPSFAGAQMTIGNILNEAGWPARAVLHYRKAAVLDPVLNEAVASEGRSLLLMGDMEEGWPKMEKRDADIKRFAELPRWQGENTGHLLLYAEQGVGDIIQFLRYIALIRDRAERISLEVPASLRRLIAAQWPALTVLTPDDPLPRADACGLLMSLPYLCKTTPETVPATVPYIKADESWRTPWHEKLSVLPSPRIGLVWRGNPLYGQDRNRSLHPEEIRPLLGMARPHFISLQKGAATATECGLCMFDAAPELIDFAATAGLIAELDLVIAVDTGVAHLAGALGKPVWILLPFAPDWRWMLMRENSPWYPSARLFRQTEPKNWSSVIANVGEELRKYVAGDRDVLAPPPWHGESMRQNPDAVPLPD